MMKERLRAKAAEEKEIKDKREKERLEKIEIENRQK